MGPVKKDAFQHYLDAGGNYVGSTYLVSVLACTEAE